MKVLIVCSGNAMNNENSDFHLHHSFIYEQTEELIKNDVEFDFYFIKGKGLSGYLRNLRKFKEKIKTYNPGIIHAHYGLSGLFANFQRKIPVITTFHGSDVFVFKRNLIVSKIASLLSVSSITVNSKMNAKFRNPSGLHTIPCGINMSIFSPYKSDGIHNKTNFNKEIKNILFSSRFDYYEKNYPLAREVINILGKGFNLIELKGYSREDVNNLMNTCDVALMTSISEGSPQFIKEAMACNCPVVSTDIGDVRELFGDIEGYYITSFDPEDIAGKIKLAIEYRKTKGQTKGRERIIELGLDSETVAARIIEVYKKVLKIGDC